MNDTPTPRTDEALRDWHYALRCMEPSSYGDWVSADLSRTLERELIEAQKLAERYRYLSCDSQEEADETSLPWENNQPTEL